MNQEIYERGLSFAHRMNLVLSAEYADLLLEEDVVISSDVDMDHKVKPKSRSLERMLARKGRA
ncbi:hypothetical protein [Sulfitobacter sp. R18_1]|uniref:hypothetical protein n=1 Tax=Sulfitobacter sp. R18_1 TaxID=2821104 RepID=UPI001AD954A6|nr:hypothetical protein [Sulfitobacter sp. R18_1]MBO9428043.1 hypothetical protein [Sulfitobacter sp. R18_1]